MPELWAKAEKKQVEIIDLTVDDDDEDAEPYREADTDCHIAGRKRRANMIEDIEESAEQRCEKKIDALLELDDCSCVDTCKCDSDGAIETASTTSQDGHNR